MRYFITLVTPRPPYHTTVCSFRMPGRYCPASFSLASSLKTIDTLNMISRATTAPPWSYTPPLGIYSLPTPPLRIPYSAGSPG